MGTECIGEGVSCWSWQDAGLYEVEVQYLIRLNDVTHVVNRRTTRRLWFEEDEHEHEHEECSLEYARECLSIKTGIPAALLSISRPKCCASASSCSSKSSTSSRCFSCSRVVYLNASIKQSILGGKGGFGTQLKNASKQAAARTTLDFGSCRDLHGRRLRRINEEVKLRKRRQFVQLKQAGKDVHEEDWLATKSGITGWYLDVPHWAMDLVGSHRLVNDKKRKIRQDLQRAKHHDAIQQQRKQQQQWHREQIKLDYANRIDHIHDDHDHEDEDGMQHAIMQGFQINKTTPCNNKKRKINTKPSNKHYDDKKKTRNNDIPASKQQGDTTTKHTSLHTDAPSNSNSSSSSFSSNCDWLCTLSGDFMELPSSYNPNNSNDNTTSTTPPSSNNNTTTPTTTGGPGVVTIQSTDDFSTGGVLLLPPSQDDNDKTCPDNHDKKPAAKDANSTTTHSSNNNTTNNTCILLREGGLIQGKWYYEVTLHTGGLAQIGWATAAASSTPPPPAAAAAAASASTGSTTMTKPDSTTDTTAIEGGFRPNSSTGDGVGDDAYSYGYDGSRGYKFHSHGTTTKTQENDGDGTNAGTTDEEDAGGMPYPSSSDNDENKDSKAIRWKAGDVLGCMLDTDVPRENSSLSTAANKDVIVNDIPVPSTAEKTTTMSYSLNGKPLGVAFVIPHSKQHHQQQNKNGEQDYNCAVGHFPALSLNRDEVMKVNMGPHFVHLPMGYRGVYDAIMMGQPHTTTTTTKHHRDKECENHDSTFMGDAKKRRRTKDDPHGNKSNGNDHASSNKLAKSTSGDGGVSTQGLQAEESISQPAEIQTPLPLDLANYNSVQELEALGLDRLKSASMAIGIKCGGSLQERAKRLFSIKGMTREEYPKKVRAKDFVL